MSADPLTELRKEPSPVQAGLAWLLETVRRLSDAIRELPNTHREWPGGR